MTVSAEESIDRGDSTGGGVLATRVEGISWLGKTAKLLFIFLFFSFSFFFLFGLTTQGRSVGKCHMSHVMPHDKVTWWVWENSAQTM